METFWQWLPVAIGGVAFLAAAAAYVRGSADKGTIESQKRLLDSRGLEIDDLTRRLGTTEETLVKAERRVTQVEADNRILRGAVAHVEELVKLQETLEHHHSDTMVALRSIASAVGE